MCIVIFIIMFCEQLFVFFFVFCWPSILYCRLIRLNSSLTSFVHIWKGTWSYMFYIYVQPSNVLTTKYLTWWTSIRYPLSEAFNIITIVLLSGKIKFFVLCKQIWLNAEYYFSLLTSIDILHDCFLGLRYVSSDNNLT